MTCSSCKLKGDFEKIKQEYLGQYMRLNEY